MRTDGARRPARGLARRNAVEGLSVRVVVFEDDAGPAEGALGAVVGDAQEDVAVVAELREEPRLAGRRPGGAGPSAPARATAARGSCARGAGSRACARGARRGPGSRAPPRAGRRARSRRHALAAVLLRMPSLLERLLDGEDGRLVDVAIPESESPAPGNRACVIACAKPSRPMTREAAAPGELDVERLAREQDQRLDPGPLAAVRDATIEEAGEHLRLALGEREGVRHALLVAIREGDRPVHRVAADDARPALDLDEVQGMVAEDQGVDLVAPTVRRRELHEGPRGGTAPCRAGPS